VRGERRAEGEGGKSERRAVVYLLLGFKFPKMAGPPIDWPVKGGEIPGAWLELKLKLLVCVESYERKNGDGRRNGDVLANVVRIPSLASTLTSIRCSSSLYFPSRNNRSLEKRHGRRGIFEACVVSRIKDAETY
jgi:hypothetical protein